MHPPPDQVDETRLDKPADQYEKTRDGDYDVVSESGHALRHGQHLRQDERYDEQYPDNVDRQLLGREQKDRQDKQKQCDQYRGH
jgi:hypothetical protein